MKNKLSVCLIVFNEEKVIERCLKSISEIADEIVIVHDGECKDETLNIAKKYNTKIFERPHIGMCEGHREFIYSKASGDWILSLDADEYLSNELKGVIKDLIEDENVDAYSFIWPYTDGKIQFSRKFPYRLCLARKNKLYQWNFPHEPMRTYGVLKYLPLIIEHWPLYDNFNLRTFRTKQKKWIKRHSEFIIKDPKEIKGFNINDPEYIYKRQMFYKERPLLKIIPQFFKVFFLQMYSGQWRCGYNGLKVTLLASSYQAYLLYEIYKLKKKKCF